MIIFAPSPAPALPTHTRERPFLLPFFACGTRAQDWTTLPDAVKYHTRLHRIHMPPLPSHKCDGGGGILAFDARETHMPPLPSHKCDGGGGILAFDARETHMPPPPSHKCDGGGGILAFNARGIHMPPFPSHKCDGGGGILAFAVRSTGDSHAPPLPWATGGAFVGG